MGHSLLTFQVDSLHCASCALEFESTLSNLPGIILVSVHYAADLVDIAYNPSCIEYDSIINTMQALGYKPTMLSDQGREAHLQAIPHHIQQAYKQLLLGGLGSLILLWGCHGWYAPMFLQNPWFMVIVATLIQGGIGWRYYVHAFHRRTLRSINKDTLIIVSSVIAYGYSLVMVGINNIHANLEIMPLCFDISAAIIFFATLTQFIELQAKYKASSRLRTLLMLQAKTAAVWRLGKWTELPINEVVVGDLIYVRPGERVPVDGFIFKGRALMDQYLITGEAAPVEKKIGDELISGSYPVNGVFEMHAVSVGSKTVLSSIIAKIKYAQSTKVYEQSIVDRIAFLYVPTIFFIASTVFLGSMVYGVTEYDALMRCISILIVANPCMVGLLTVASVIVAVGLAAQEGIIVKDAQVVRNVGMITAMLFDKTGIITMGQRRVEYFIIDGRASEVIKQLGILDDATLYVVTAILAMERGSRHSIAIAVQEFIEKHYPRRLAVAIDQYELIMGFGLKAHIDNHEMLIGSKMFMGKAGIVIPSNILATSSKWASQGKTISFVALHKQIVAYFCVADTIHADAKNVVAALKRQGILTILWSSGSEKTAHAIAQEVGIEAVHAELLEEDKHHFIAQLKNKGHRIALLENGTHAGAFEADVTILMGTGADIALKTEQTVFLQSNLWLLPRFMKLSQKMKTNIRQNIVWTCSYNLLFITLASGLLYPMFGFSLHPLVACLVMTGSTTLLMANALRLKKIS